MRYDIQGHGSFRNTGIAQSNFEQTIGYQVIRNSNVLLRCYSRFLVIGALRHRFLHVGTWLVLKGKTVALAAAVSLCSIGFVIYLASGVWRNAPSEDVESNDRAERADYRSVFDKPDDAVELSALECLEIMKQAYELRDTFRVHYHGLYAVEHLKGEELPLLIELMEDEDGDEWSTLRLVALIRGSVVDPEGLMQLMNSLEEGDKVMGVIQNLFRYWAKADPEGVIRFSLESNDRIRRFVYSGLQMSGSAEVAAFLQQNMDFFQQNGSAALDASSLAELESAIATELWREDLEQFAQLLVRGYNRNPSQAMEIALGISDLGVRKQLVEQVLSWSSWPSPVEGMQWLARLDDDLLSAQQHRNILVGFASRSNAANLKGTIQWMRKNLSRGDYVIAVQQMHPRDAAMAKAFLDPNVLRAIPNSSFKKRTISNSVSRWAQEEPEAATQWAERNLEGADFQAFQSNRIHSVMNTEGFHAALEMVDSLESEYSKTQVLNSIAHSWMNRNPTEMLDWVFGLEDVEQSYSLLKQVSSTWTEVDLDGARAFAENLPQGELKSEYMQRIFHHLNQYDPVSAMEVAARMEDDGTRSRAISQSLNQIASENPQLAMEFAMEISSSENEARVFSSTITNQWARYAPEESLYYFNAVEDATIRSSGVAQSIGFLMQEDLPGAIEFVAENDFGNRDQVILQLANGVRNSGSNERVEEVRLLIDTMSDEHMAKRVNEALDAEMRSRLFSVGRAGG